MFVFNVYGIILAYKPLKTNMPSQIDLRGQPDAPTILQETRKFFTDAQEQAPHTYELDPSEHTVDGFIELGWEHLQLQRTLHLDFQHSIADWDRAKLEDEAQPIILAMNASREQQGVGRLEVASIGETFLRRLVEPNWTHEITEPSFTEEVKKYPEHMQANLEELREVDGKLRVLSNDPELRTAADKKSHEEIRAIKAATSWIKTDTSIDACSKKISELYQVAAASGRPLTKADKKRIERLEARQADLRSHQGHEITSLDMIEPTSKQIERLERRKRRREFESGLVVTESMKQTISEVLPSLARGNPALFVGETGGAKTALAEFIASEYMGKDAELISGYSDVNGYQLMGKTGLNSKDGATVSEFIAGPVVRAMEAGVPLILDEINAMPAEFMKRLNKILQLRPGDRMTIQEDSGREVIVQSGFCIMATANEKSKRYKGVDDLSSELQNRFAASTYRIRYPDHDTANGETPKENLMIAVAALTDEIGEFAVDLPDGQLEQFVKIAHITQKLFSGEYGDSEKKYIPTDRRADNTGYGLEEAVLAPRTMVAILSEVRASYGSIPLEKVIKRWVDGVKNKADKAVITTILSSNPLELRGS
jgi:MoxR-like ATPase